jgi:hypothetical protein
MGNSSWAQRATLTTKVITTIKVIRFEEVGILFYFYYYYFF